MRGAFVLRPFARETTADSLRKFVCASCNGKRNVADRREVALWDIGLIDSMWMGSLQMNGGSIQDKSIAFALVTGAPRSLCSRHGRTAGSESGFTEASGV